MPDQMMATTSTRDAAGAESTLGAAVSTMTRTFADARLETPALDARRLTVSTLNLDPVLLLRDPERALSAEDVTRLAEVTARRLAREPVSRIEGKRWFRGLHLDIDPTTLDPRPDTETLVEAVLDLVRGQAAPEILDLGTGSGAVIVALLDRLPGATGVGADIDEAALRIAARNAARHGLLERARFQRSDWLDQINGQFDVVVSNPPYITSSELAALEPEVARFDPALALDGGPDGLTAYRAIARRIAKLLKPKGWVVVEVGAGQCEAVSGILAGAFADAASIELRTWRDLGGVGRCVAIRARE